MPQKILVNKFEWIKDNSQFYEDFMKKVITKKMMKGIFYFLENDVKYPDKYYVNLIMIYYIYQKE